MDCKAFIAWLDEGGLHTSPSQSQAFLEHSSKCERCQKELEAQQKILESLDLWRPKPHESEELIQNVLRKKLSQDDSPSFQPRWFFSWAIPALTVLFLFVFLFQHFKNARTSDFSNLPASEIIGTVVGEATIVRADTSVKVQAAFSPQKFAEGDRFILQQADTCQIELDNSRKIYLSGSAEFTMTSKSLTLSKGRVRMVFSKTAGGWKVKLPQAILGIRGTILYLEVSNEASSVWLEEGSVEWAENLTGKKGILNPKDGIVFSKMGISKISQSPLEKGPVSFIKPRFNDPKNTATSVSSINLPGDNGSKTASQIGSNSWRTNDGL